MTLRIAGVTVVLLLAIVGGPRSAAEPELGQELYLTGCASCHGFDGGGTERGPDLRAAGEAGAYYYLQTGRMPLANDDDQPRRKPPAYDPDEITALVRYVGGLGRGPRIPRIDADAGDLAVGGEVYRANCASCHAAAGIGGALSYGRSAPSLHDSEPTVVAAALRIGPGQMPVFDPGILDRHERDSVARYVRLLAHPPTAGGASLGGAGPIPEGLVAWLFGLGTLLLATAWIGTRTRRT